MSFILRTLSFRIISSDSHKAVKQALLHGKLKSVLNYNSGETNSPYQPLEIKPQL